LSLGERYGNRTKLNEKELVQTNSYNYYYYSIFVSS